MSWHSFQPKEAYLLAHVLRICERRIIDGYVVAPQAAVAHAPELLEDDALHAAAGLEGAVRRGAHDAVPHPAAGPQHPAFRGEQPSELPRRAGVDAVAQVGRAAREHDGPLHGRHSRRGRAFPKTFFAPRSGGE